MAGDAKVWLPLGDKLSYGLAADRRAVRQTIKPSRVWRRVADHQLPGRFVYFGDSLGKQAPNFLLW